MKLIFNEYFLSDKVSNNLVSLIEVEKTLFYIKFNKKIYSKTSEKKLISNYSIKIPFNSEFKSIITNYIFLPENLLHNYIFYQKKNDLNKSIWITFNKEKDILCVTEYNTDNEFIIDKKIANYLWKEYIQDYDKIY